MTEPDLDAGAPPLVASSIVAGVRRLIGEHTDLLAVRRALAVRHPEAVESMDAPPAGEWADAHKYSALLEATREMIGEAQLRTLGRARVLETQQSGALSPLLRSWTRSYSEDPVQFLRVAPHTWAAGTRNLGRMKLASSRPGEVRFELEGAPPMLRTARAWLRFLEGFGDGLLEIAHLSGTCSIGSSPDRGDVIDVVFRWS